ncbi:hypothetical protein CYLTODRAFT_402308 [Cylindrobasidium torrendii FP15055 ss-10]|uniref:Uncharacterized protein n=1 Tax=Cylindrobasidium torrendii FP15055 ss-10 TaxID=1314674 RepID=A0A0D7B0H3_9AGAR|nr:hypothetical protein CYLTODRAFT_402308 [Cylindrobasidium torrendii FP15055 ss-10]
MKLITTLALASYASAAALSSSLTEASKRQTNLRCGGAEDSQLADCQHLYDNWPNYLDATWDALCTTNVVQRAYNPACYGTCCVFTTSNAPLWDDIHTAVGTILDCRSEEKGTVNGQVDVGGSKAGRICLANRNSCGDCFDKD